MAEGHRQCNKHELWQNSKIRERQKGLACLQSMELQRVGHDWANLFSNNLI